jgi:hypothetical protein
MAASILGIVHWALEFEESTRRQARGDAPQVATECRFSREWRSGEKAAAVGRSGVRPPFQSDWPTRLTRRCRCGAISRHRSPQSPLASKACFLPKSTRRPPLGFLEPPAAGRRFSASAAPRPRPQRQGPNYALGRCLSEKGRGPMASSPRRRWRALRRCCGASTTRSPADASRSTSALPRGRRQSPRGLAGRQRCLVQSAPSGDRRDCAENSGKNKSPARWVFDLRQSKLPG